MQIDSPFEQAVTFIYVSDLDASSRFYGEVLGLPMALDQGGCRIFGVTQTAFIGCCTTTDAPHPKGVILTLVSDELSLWHERLVAAGVTVEKSPSFNDKYNITHLFARDPDGYLVEIQTFHDPLWPVP